ncbi:MAG: thiamine-phosphate diphosphorylase [Spirochaetes bacterium GWD1_27_9]|nr:MAG: thiamine-phosphate diphosphorylase [Spirochaetes bacterium GWB1_27_13]OHD20021.1 MAG: thiamine-phosphate diphosphorylase [Spirochaetes bacterium GWC1_27_15]OHD30488.1 MAG: thiamine-phosphate diphosphorylase [Spirochaetes bacterium GWD1_27_9]
MNFNFGLYPVITEEFCNGRDMIFVLEEIIKGGAKIIQLRQKKTNKKKVYQLALKYRKITKQNNVILIINDHVDIALAVEADGVHLGQDDLPCDVARKLAPNLIIGVSTHNEEEIQRAERDGASYINIGPIFATSTKELGINPLGLEYLKNAKTNLPFSVMGGIKKNNIPTLLECNVKNIAMVTEITMAENIQEKVRELVLAINSGVKN